MLFYQVWQDFLTKQDELIEEIKILENNVFSSIEKQEIEEAENYLENAEKILENIIEETFKNKWKDIRQTVSKLRADYDNMVLNSKNIVEELQKEIEKYKENDEIDLLIENCQSIIIHYKILKDEPLTKKYTKLLENSLGKKRLIQLQVNIDELRKESKIRLQEGNLIASLDLYDKIINELENYKE